MQIYHPTTPERSTQPLAGSLCRTVHAVSGLQFQHPAYFDSPLKRVPKSCELLRKYTHILKLSFCYLELIIRNFLFYAWVCTIVSSQCVRYTQATDRTYSVTVKDVDLLWNFVDFSNFICIIKTSIGKENKAKRSSCIGKFHYSDTANLYL